MLDQLDEHLGAAAAGDSQATETLYHAFIGDLTAFARQQRAVDPEATAHTAFERTMRKLPDFETRSVPTFRAYLRKTARNLTIDEARRNKARPKLARGHDQVITDLADPAPPFEDYLADSELLNELLDNLTASQREVIEYRFFDDLSLEDTAERTDRSVTAVKAMQRRALFAMRAALALTIVAVLIIVGVRANRTDPRELPVISETPAEPVDETPSEGDGPVDAAPPSSVESVPNETIENEAVPDAPIDATGGSESSTAAAPQTVAVSDAGWHLPDRSAPVTSAPDGAQGVEEDAPDAADPGVSVQSPGHPTQGATIPPEIVIEPTFEAAIPEPTFAPADSSAAVPWAQAVDRTTPTAAPTATAVPEPTATVPTADQSSAPTFEEPTHVPGSTYVPGSTTNYGAQYIPDPNTIDGAQYIPDPNTIDGAQYIPDPNTIAAYEPPAIPTVEPYQPPAAFEPPSLSALEPPAIAAFEPPSLSALEPPAIAAFEPPPIPTVEPYEPPAAFEPPSLTALEPPAIAAYEPPSLSALEPPAIAAYEPPSLSALEPPAIAAYEPPSLSASEPPAIAAIEPPSLSASEPPAIAAYEPPTVPGYEVPSFEMPDLPSFGRSNG